MNHYEFCLPKIIDFFEQLKSESESVWIDNDGKYRVIIKQSAIVEELAKLGSVNLFLADYLKHYKNQIEQVFFDRTLNPKYLVSVGSFTTHNTVRNHCWKSDKSFVTIPAPLANDSFGTNRCVTSMTAPSVKCIYPVLTIFDLELLERFPFSSNILGLGEFVGLYYSAIDYFLCQNKPLPVDLLAFLVQIYEEIHATYRHSYVNLLSIIAMALTVKSVVMRDNQDHEIGCKIDHLFAHVIENRFQFPHGKSVYLGSLIASVLFPSWQKFGIGSQKIVDIGVNVKLISAEDIYLIRDLNPLQLIKNAISSRPNRKTALETLLQKPQEVNRLWYDFGNI